MSLWHPTRIVTKLSQLEIDVNKDWAKKNITNFGSGGINLYNMVTAHASRHASGGADPVSLDASQITSGQLNLARLPDTVKMFYSGAQVFYGSAPDEWTDLDLSSVVGARRCFVILKLKNHSSPYPEDYRFRPNGDTDDYRYAISCVADIDETMATLVAVITDEAGIVEWKTIYEALTTVWVLAYVPLV